MLPGNETALLEDAIVRIAALPHGGAVGGHFGDARLEEDAVLIVRGLQGNALADPEDGAGDIEANDGRVVLG